jgi:RNase H-fold protein (predicted Holliday junction resolvase)
MNEYLLALDVSTTTIGIALFENENLKFLKQITPKIKTKNKNEELFLKVDLFEKIYDALNFKITKIIIEEPLLQSNNVYTIATLLKFNGMISKSVYDHFHVLPEYISSYDARKYAFPELMAVRKFKKDGTPLTEKAISKNQPVLFGAYPFDADKKHILWEKVAEHEPQIMWEYKNNKLIKETFDMSDAYVVGKGYMNKIKLQI